MNLTVTLRLAISLAIGLIIGMERGWESRESPTGLRIAGIRSFGFVGLLGGLSALLAAQVGVSVLGIAFLGLALIVAVSYGVTTQKTQDFGITTVALLAIVPLIAAGAIAIRTKAAESSSEIELRNPICCWH
ncbi:MAG: MgtC/SapB family protein [Cyanobacteria bacterium CRU_2_1]|nr:MgtC/SapB family protein [Cyanobacteria bacterium CRU_2_1]